MEYQPKTGERCACRRGLERDNCPACEGTGWQIDFAAIHRRRLLMADYEGEARVARAEESSAADGDLGLVIAEQEQGLYYEGENTP